MRNSARRDDRTTDQRAIRRGFLEIANSTDSVPLVKRQQRQPRRLREQRQLQQLPRANRQVGQLVLFQDFRCLEFELAVAPDRRRRRH